MTVPLPVKRNAVRCIDCDETYVDPTLIACPEDFGHAIEAAYISDTPLGVQPVSSDDDNRIFRNYIHHFQKIIYFNIFMRRDNTAWKSIPRSLHMRIGEHRLNVAIKDITGNAEPVHHVTDERSEKRF